MSLALWLLAYLLLSFGIGRLFDVVLGWKTVGFLFYPGMLVGALGRLIGCMVSQQKHAELDLMRSSGPTGDEENLPPGLWFRFAYAIAPFLLGLAAFCLAWRLLDEPLDFDRTLPVLGFEVEAAEEGVTAAGTQLSAFLSALGEQEIGNWRTWVFLYLGFALIVTSAPSKNDLMGIGVFCGVVGLVLSGLTEAGVEVGMRRLYRGAFWDAFSFLVAMALFVLVASTLVLLPIKFLRRGSQEK